MSFSKKRRILSCFALVACISASASAQSVGDIYLEGFELNPIEPTPAGDRFFLVPGGFSDPDSPDYAGPIHAKVFTHFALTPNLVGTDEDTGEDIEYIQNQLYAHANVTAYVLPWLMLNADLPIAVYQRGDGPVNPRSAFGDLRFGARFGLFGKRTSAFAISPGVDVWFPIGSTNNLTGDTNFRSEPYLSLGGQASIFIYSAKVGYQFRHAVNEGQIETGGSLTYGAALGLSLFDRAFQIGPEFIGRSLVVSESDQAFSSDVSPMTAALGARYQFGDFNLGAGFGLGLTDAPGDASRIMLSFSYNPVSWTPVDKKKDSDSKGDGDPQSSEDSDGDGIIDSEDACPESMGFASEKATENGCPDSSPQGRGVTPASADKDQDGIPDTEDSCPDEAGEASEDSAMKGCPAGSAELIPLPASVAPIDSHGSTATWLGFRKLSDKSALLYVNLSSNVEVESESGENTLTYTFKKTRIESGNNRNPLLTEHFASVVKSARLVTHDEDVQLVIELNGKATTTPSLVKNEQGVTFQVRLSRSAN